MATGHSSLQHYRQPTPTVRRVLVVDDEPEARNGLRKLLAGDGFTVSTAGGGAEALVEIVRSPPDVVLTDLRMIPTSGIDLCQRVHEIDGEISVIVMTAHSDMDSVIDSLRAGAEDYLLKPLQYEVVLHCIERALERRDAQRERAASRQALAEQLVLNSLRAEEHAAAAELHRAQQAALLENLEEGVTIADATGRIVMINAAACAILGITPDDVPTVAALNAIPTYDAHEHALPADERPVVRALRGEHYTEYEVVRIRPNGERRRVTSTGTFVKDAKGNVAQAIVVSRDITELKRLEQQREEYTALISHDLRNPLSSILGFVALLKSSLARENSALVELAERAQRNVTRMAAMLDELTEATSLENGGVTMHLEPRDLLALLQGIVSGFDDQSRSRITVETDGSDSFVVLGDAPRLERVIANLLTNALKYSANDAPVKARIANRDGAFVLSVSDRGIGIAPEHRHALFDRFYRTTAGRAHAGGLGLGLYIARQIIEAHGGRIRVSSMVGAGSTFTITLPAP